MELKCELYMIHRIESASSNRTFMELKLNFTRRRARWRLSSNRTFMELKCFRSLRKGIFRFVLIVPLWN